MNILSREKQIAIIAALCEGMINDGQALPTIRTLEELRADVTFLEDAKGAVVVDVPLDLP